MPSYDNDLHENFGVCQNDPTAIDTICSDLTRDEETMNQTELEELIYQQEFVFPSEREPTKEELEAIDNERNS